VSSRGGETGNRASCVVCRVSCGTWNVERGTWGVGCSWLWVSGWSTCRHSPWRSIVFCPLFACHTPEEHFPLPTNPSRHRSPTSFRLLSRSSASPAEIHRFYLNPTDEEISAHRTRPPYLPCPEPASSRWGTAVAVATEKVRSGRPIYFGMERRRASKAKKAKKAIASASSRSPYLHPLRIPDSHRT
jgi:hypothetical protein